MSPPNLRLDALLLSGMERAKGHARGRLRDALDELPVLNDASLCMTELITNARRYTTSGWARVMACGSRCPLWLTWTDVRSRPASAS